MISDRKTVVALSYAGLLPMMVCTILIFDPFLRQLLIYYSLAIIAFLAGAWWSATLMNRQVAISQRRMVLVLSNMVVLTAVALAAFSPFDAAIFLGYVFLFAFLLIGEVLLSTFRPQPGYYLHMRRNVSCIAIGLHAVAAFRLVMN